MTAWLPREGRLFFSFEVSPNFSLKIFSQKFIPVFSLISGFFKLISRVKINFILSRIKFSCFHFFDIFPRKNSKKPPQSKKPISSSTLRPLVFLILFLFLPLCRQAFANELTISNPALGKADSAAKTREIQFDVAWSNSWRNTTSWDAAWVFFKYRASDGVWHHCTLKQSGTNPTGTSVGTGTSVSLVVPTDKKGLFVMRSETGSGSVSVSQVKVVWDYNADGLSNEATNVEVKVFGIEMIYVPAGAYFLGDGNGSIESPMSFHATDNTKPLLSSSTSTSATSDLNIRVDANANDDATLESGVGICYQGIDDNNDGNCANGNGNNGFPTGKAPFYVMKHEVTEGMWVDFFNSLTSAQKANRDVTSNETTGMQQGGKNSDSTVHRNTISLTSQDAVTSRPYRACSFLSWMDAAALADWAALRPMSELEFEAMARGKHSETFNVTVGEYAWGSIVASQASTISGAEDGSETVSSPVAANANFGNVTLSGGDGSSGPLRSGIFTSATSSREKAGAGYYGHMELSGNLWERVVSIGSSAGRNFKGTHGDGELVTGQSGFDGNATNTDWPGISSTAAQGVSLAAGSGLRGGSWLAAENQMAVSDRSRMSSTNSRDSDTGFRAARTAP